MSSANGLPLTKEQEEFLKELEEEFKNRYTENDPDFMEVFNEKPAEPPIMANWFEDRSWNRPRGDHYRNDYNDRRPGYHAYEGERREYNDRHHGYHSYERESRYSHERRHRYRDYEPERRGYHDPRYEDDGPPHSSRRYHHLYNQKPY